MLVETMPAGKVKHLANQECALTRLQQKNFIFSLWLASAASSRPVNPIYPAGIC
jgi:hypothetical protein